MDTIKSGTEISILFKEGKRYSSSCATLLAKHGEEEHGPRGRVAFIAGKKLGNAVWRNRAKRRLRAVVKDIGGPWQGFDMVFIAKSTLTQTEYSKVCRQCSSMVEKALKDQAQGQ